MDSIEASCSGHCLRTALTSCLSTGWTCGSNLGRSICCGSWKCTLLHDGYGMCTLFPMYGAAAFIIPDKGMLSFTVVPSRVVCRIIEVRVGFVAVQSRLRMKLQF